MTVLVTGSNGLIGSSVAAFFGSAAVGLGKGVNRNPYVNDSSYISWDLNNFQGLYYILEDPRWRKISSIVHCAAYTNVDQAEKDDVALQNVNVKATEVLVKFAKSKGIRMVYVSSDYVFDGTIGYYKEHDTPNPINKYGLSKLEAEHIIASVPDSVIVRTSTPYTFSSSDKVDFARWVYTSLAKGDKINIVTDQTSNPTYVPHLARLLGELAFRPTRGILHAVGDVPLSRYDFAKAIAKSAKLDERLITPILTTDLKQPAKRPLISSLDTSLLQGNTIGHKMPQLETHAGFKEFIKEMKKSKKKTPKIGV